MKRTSWTTAGLLAGLALPALAAAAPAVDESTLQKLLNRLDKLEARNNALEEEIKVLKNENRKVTESLDSPRLSENEPELTTRLKAVEKDALDMKKSARIAEQLEGIHVSASLATVAQKAWGLPEGLVNGPTQLNYRGDVSVEMPLQPLGDTEHKLFAHVRLGQGLGLNAAFSDLGYHASAPNAVAFRASGANPDDSVALLGQAWYQATIPLPFMGFKPHSRETLTLTFGKMDIFGFFDQNAVAGDEARQFLNSAFVHNPLLDAGGETGVDANGFQPGFIASYDNYTNKPEAWRLALGIFGAGDRGANYQHSLNAPLVMAQAEKQLRLLDGLPGNYRVYAWNRSRSSNFDGTSGRHHGLGVSIDQQVSDNLSLYGRYGKLLKGEARFDQTLTLGTELSGSAWNRGADALGLSLGWLQSGKGYRSGVYGTSCPAGYDTLGTCQGLLTTFTPQGSERIVELYYRYRLSPQFELSPDLQYIAQGGGNPAAKAAKIFALRANIAY